LAVGPESDAGNDDVQAAEFKRATVEEASVAYRAARVVQLLRSQPCGYDIGPTSI
jgi:hypothetical protein